jgi:hypothetical protein
MPYEIEKLLRPELASGERLLWTGMPGSGLRLRGSDAFLIPFSLMWGGFAMFWEYMVLSTPAPLVMKFWGVPFVLVGLYLIVGRFFFDSYQRGRTWYGVTDQRVLIVGGLVGREVKSLALEGLNDVSLKERGDGSGDIVFGQSSPWGNSPWSNPSWPGARKQAPSFQFIAQARSVYNIIRDAKRDLR